MSRPFIRPLQESDWPQVHALVVEVASAGETYAMDVPRSEAETREFWSGQHVVVAVDGEPGEERVLGSAKLGPNRPAQGSHVGTASFMVGSAARGRGIGRAMGEYAVEWHRSAGFEAIQFNAVVSTNTAAIKLWHSLGFETIGIVPDAFRLPGGEGCPSYADLHVMYLRVKDSPGD
jgi:ribosomal protein S18 acetylase RimI-like enzyme